MNCKHEAAETMRILIVDDHAIVREGLRALISIEPDMEVVAEAADGVEACVQARSLRPHVILMDLVMPRKDGITSIQEIKMEVPESRILVLTSYAEDEKVFSAIKAGALGYVLKECSPQELLKAIRLTYRGESSLHPIIAYKLIREFNQPEANSPNTLTFKDTLTEREAMVLNLIAHGLSNHEIAERLTVSDRTVHVYVRKVFEKLHVVNRTQAALYAVREGLVQLEED